VKKTQILAKLTALIMIFILAACGQNTSNSSDASTNQTSMDKVSFRLNWTAQGSHASIFYGIKAGIFEKYNIYLTAGEGKGSSNTINLIATKNDTFGFADFGTMSTLVTQGAPVKVIAPVYMKLSSAVISIEENGIAKPEDIIGKKIGITEGDGPHKLFPAFLKSVGIEESQVELIPMESTAKVAALLSGQVDAILGGFDDQPFQISSKGSMPTVIAYADYDVNVIGMAVVANNETISNNPDLCRRFVQAYAEAWAETAKNSEGALDALVEAFPDLDRETASNQLNSALDCLESERSSDICKTDDQFFLDSIEMFKSYTNLNIDTKPEDLYTTQFLPE